MNNLKEYKDLFLPVAIVAASLVLGGALVYSGGVNITTKGESGAQPTGGGAVQPRTVDNNGSTVDFIITADDHIRGNPEAKITLVEFSDLQCPFCQQFHLTVQQALTEYGDDLRWVYKHFPLDAIHPNARPAAEASECVWEQKGDEGFWQFADAMFEQQERLSSSFYREMAQSLGMNLVQFDDCVSGRKYQDKVEQDYQEGIQAGVAGTPGSFVNGVPVRGAVPFDENSPGYQPGAPTLKAIIDSVL
ncbi:MAG: thioredoxin domain-containing protein [bacterium]|nr:thioredoxin domain-containing protein [bacterium]